MHRILSAVVLSLLVCPAVGQTTPVIAEFMADNNATITDRDGDASDWVEIHNPTSASINLTGWFLTDDSASLKKWAFPNPTTIVAGGYLVVFASAKDRAVSNQELHTNFKLKSGGEYIGLVDAGGKVVSDHGFRYPQQFADVSYGFEFKPGLTTKRVYFPRATPGRANGLGGAVVGDVTHRPVSLKANTDCVVTAEIVNPNNATVSSVVLKYRVHYGSEATTAMRDDGKPPDVTANDGRWTGLIPQSLFSAGQMIRWRVESTIQGGPTAKSPPYLSASNSPRYFGTNVEDPSVNHDIPVFYWWTANPTAAITTTGTRCSVAFRGEFYDNVFVRNRGGSSKWYKKQSLKFDFNKGNHFRFDPNVGRAEEININSTYADKAFLRQILAYETLRDAGVKSSVTFPVRQELNGQFYMVSIFIEQVDEDYLDRQDLDPNGALYKVYNTFTTASKNRNEKKTRRGENWNDLINLMAGVNNSNTGLRETYLWDNIDIPACINYWACIVIMHDNDVVHKNYYIYRDTEGDEEWRFLPWDKDLTFGRNYTRSGGVLNDVIYYNWDPQSHPLFGDASHLNFDRFYNRLVHAMHSVPRIREMYLRRLRTLMDQILNEASTPKANRYFERRIAMLKPQMTAAVALDQKKWGVPAYGNRTLDFAKSLDILANTYLAGRRTHLFTKHGAPAGIIPAKQPSLGFGMGFGLIEVNPVSKNVKEQFVEIVNCHKQAMDISGWSLRGAGSGIEFTFEPGTVLSNGGSVFVAADPKAFRARTTSPKGGERRLVVGPFDGTLQTHLGLVLYDERGFPTTATGEFGYSLSSTGKGDVKLSVSGARPSSHLWILFSLDNSGVPGCGPIIGLGVDVLPLINLPLGTAPVHVLTDANGGYAFSAPNNTVPIGSVLTSRAAYVDSKSRIVVSEVRRQKF
jgi:hypothetical protein